MEIIYMCLAFMLRNQICDYPCFICMPTFARRHAVVVYTFIDVKSNDS